MALHLSINPTNMFILLRKNVLLCCGWRAVPVNGRKAAVLCSILPVHVQQQHVSLPLGSFLSHIFSIFY